MDKMRSLILWLSAMLIAISLLNTVNQYLTRDKIDSLQKEIAGLTQAIRELEDRVYT